MQLPTINLNPIQNRKHVLGTKARNLGSEKTRKILNSSNIGIKYETIDAQASQRKVPEKKHFDNSGYVFDRMPEIPIERRHLPIE